MGKWGPMWTGSGTGHLGKVLCLPQFPWARADLVLHSQLSAARAESWTWGFWENHMAVLLWCSLLCVYCCADTCSPWRVVSLADTSASPPSPSCPQVLTMMLSLPASKPGCTMPFGLLWDVLFLVSFAAFSYDSVLPNALGIFRCSLWTALTSIYIHFRIF